MWESLFWPEVSFGLTWAAPVEYGVDVPTAAQTAEKYARVTPGRTQDYTQGIQTTSPAQFEAAAIASADVWQQGVTQAAAENRFERGLEGSGARWRRKAEQVGASRFGPGVQAGREDYQAGVQPYLQALAAITLDPRGPRGDPRNVGRVAQIAQVLNQTRRGTSR